MKQNTKFCVVWGQREGAAGAELTPAARTQIQALRQRAAWGTARVTGGGDRILLPRQKPPKVADAQTSQGSRGGLSESKMEDGLRCRQRDNRLGVDRGRTGWGVDRGRTGWGVDGGRMGWGADRGVFLESTPVLQRGAVP